MKKVYYISYEAYYTADESLLPILAQTYDIRFFLIQSTPSIIENEALVKLSKNRNLTILAIRPAGRRRSLKQIPHYFRLLRTINAESPDVVFIAPAHNIYLSILSPLMLSKSNTLIAYHDVVPHLKETNFLKDLSQDLFKYLFKNFHFFSRTQMEVFKSIFKGKVCSYAPLVIKEDRTNAPRIKKTSVPTRFLFFGNIKYYKGLDLLIEASEQLNREGVSDFKVVIAGTGEHWEFCRCLIKTPQLYELHIGFVEESAVQDLFSSSDYLVLPYRDVTQSGPLALSHSFCLPSIASEHPGFEEHIFHGKNGYLFDNENVQSLKETMKNCIELDAEGYNDVVRSLKSYTDRVYSNTSILARYQAAFETL